jgi:hypothetical protein
MFVASFQTLASLVHFNLQTVHTLAEALSVFASSNGLTLRLMSQPLNVLLVLLAAHAVAINVGNSTETSQYLMTVQGLQSQPQL